ncbi:general secretion pathway protein F [Oxalobacteraceae bacterium GrIS 2.11]
MRFTAKVMNAAGSIDLMELEADTKEDAAQRLRSDGVRVVALQSMESGFQFQFNVKQFPLDVFNQQLLSLLEAGQSIVDAIEILHDNDLTGRDQKVYRTLLLALRQGRQLSSAMEQQSTIFPPLYVAMVRATETMGGVKEAIQRFMEYRIQVAVIRRKLVAASVYPAILVTVGLLVVSFLLLYVVPRFSIAFDDIHNKKQLAGFVYIWGSWVRNHSELAWSSFAGLITVLTVVIIHPASRRFAMRKLIQIPAIGRRIQIFQLARLYRTLGLLLRSGLPLTHSLRLTRDSLPSYLYANLDGAYAQVTEGLPLSRALSQNQLATEVASRLLVAGESSGNLDDMLERVANFHDQEVSGWVDLFGRILEPTLMVGIGLVIGVVVLLLYMPIFELANSVR